MRRSTNEFERPTMFRHNVHLRDATMNGTRPVWMRVMSRGERVVYSSRLPSRPLARVGAYVVKLTLKKGALGGAGGLYHGLVAR